MDSTVFDSGTENIYASGLESETLTTPANSMQWIKFVTEYEFDSSGNMTKSVITTYDIPSVPVWEAFPPLISADLNMDNGEIPSEEAVKDMIDKNKTFYDVLARSLCMTGFQKWVDDGVTEEVLVHFMNELDRRNLKLRLTSE